MEWYHYIIPKRLTLMNPPIYKWLCFVFRLDKKDYDA